MSEFMEWAEGDDFITEDMDVRDSCEGAWDAAWALQGHRINKLEAIIADAKLVIERQRDERMKLEAQVAELQAHRDAAWEGSGGMPSYAELTVQNANMQENLNDLEAELAELEKERGFYAVVEARNDVLQAKYDALREAVLDYLRESTPANRDRMGAALIQETPE